MAHESFENARIAEALNRDFVSIKVDREERPDVDAYYMEACMAYAGSGGWPLSAFLFHDRRPFFAGTYFPPEDGMGRIGFPTLLSRIAEVWHADRASLEDAANAVGRRLAADNEASGREASAPAALREAAKAAAAQLCKRFDPTYGGFGGAPKFPTPHHLMFLMRCGPIDAPGPRAALATLRALSEGGIRDPLDGGFCRYSTDAKWLLPHFEKMMTDNALLLRAYSEAAWRSGERRFLDVASGIVRWMTGMMRGGGFQTAQDADCGGQEGGHALFRRQEIQAALGKDAERFCGLYAVTQGGNVHGHGIPNGMNVLYRLGKSFTQEDEAFAEGCLARLRIARADAAVPAVDTKRILTANAMAVSGLCHMARAVAACGARGWDSLPRAEDLTNMAVGAAEFIQRELVRDGVPRQSDTGDAPAALDGAAYHVDALLSLYGATSDPRWLERAVARMAYIQSAFADGKGGVQYACAASELPMRPRNAQDNAAASGHSMLAQCLCALHHLTGDPAYGDALDALLASLASDARRSPLAYTALLTAQLMREDAVDIALTPGVGEAALWRAAMQMAPEAYLLRAGVAPADREILARLAPEAAARAGIDGKAAAYVCAAGACWPPVTDAAGLARVLAKAAEA